MPDTDRLHALDAVRAFALLAGIVLHATMSFIMPIPALDRSQSTTLAVIFYVIHIFRMSAFYVIAGFFARMLVERRGVRAFLVDRSRRILVPLVGGWIVLAPVTIAVVIWGIYRSFGGVIPSELQAAQPAGFPLTHLWFLYYLCLFYGAFLVIRWLFHTVLDRAGRVRRAVDEAFGGMLGSYLAPIVLAAPTVAVLHQDPAWMPWAGIPTPEYGFTPQVPALAAFGAAFGVGWLVHRRADRLAVWRRQWPVNLTAAVVLTVACLILVGPAPDGPGIAGSLGLDEAPRLRLLYAASYGLAIWTWTFGIVGLALRYCADPSPTRRYVADASYWLYLVHLPLVFFLQAVVSTWPVHWAIKYPVIVAVATTLLLWSYGRWVRPTWIGALLNGRRRPPLRAESGA